MKPSARIIAASTAALFAAMPAITSAQNSKPGLWESTTQMQGAGAAKVDAAMADMQKQLAGMPPEQRKMVEDMMAKQGMKLGGAPGGGMKVQTCVTPEMASRDEFGAAQPGDCKQTRLPRSGNTVKFKFECTNPPSKGEGQVTFTSRDAYELKITSTSSVDGKPQTMDILGSGKWLSADCGNVKPIAAPQ